MSKPNNQPIPGFYIETEPLEWPVTVRVPVNGGDFAEYQFTGIFARLSESEFDALANADVDADDPSRSMSAVLEDNARKFAQMLLGWKGVNYRDGSAVPFSSTSLAAQVTGPNGAALSRGIWQALREIRYGERLGNSAPQPEPGHSGEPAAAA